MTRRRILLGFFLTMFVAVPPANGTAADKITSSAADFFETEIRPLLAERCQRCHGESKPKSGLRLTSRDGVLRGGENGPAAVPGKPEESLLIQAIRYEGELKMPPNEKLTQIQIDRLTRWVKLGLPWPESRPDKAVAVARQAEQYEITDEQHKFWSFQPLTDGSPPVVRNAAWCQSPIDRFILAGLEARGLAPAPPADKRTLIRRATFDLTGLPPTPAELDAFLADPEPDAFVKVVDRLLDSPHYGERWARHWLDVVRYTDSFDARILSGPGTIMDITEAYRYRDWVVNAFNQDLPYDQFILHQIAGDLIPPKEPGGVNIPGIVATGLLAIGNWGGGDADKEKLLTDIADDQVDVVSRAFLGLTVACARCHDHKFDPIPTEDYYSLAGIFFSSHILQDPGPKTNGPPMLRIPLVPKAEWEQHQWLKARITALQTEIEKANREHLAGLIRGLLPFTMNSLVAAWEVQRQARRLVPRKKEFDQLKQSLRPIPYANGIQEGGCPKSPQVGFHDVPVHIRGRYDRLGKLVPRRFPRILAGDNQTPITHGSGRMELARWIASLTNPLTARVMVNRIWQHHFGQGIVRTPGNFGKLGERPTHPELLDYLARSFLRSGWSVKAMHRAILLSATYQQSSQATPHTLQADPENRLLGHMKPRRLEAEEIRDTLLSVAGRLDPALGGRASQDFDRPRRTLYLMTVRSDRSTFRELFDAADSTAIIDQRSQSTVAPQALFLLNHPFALKQAKALAERIQREGPKDDRGKVEHLYRLLFGRPPVAAEIEIGQKMLAEASSNGPSLEAYCQVLLCTNEFVYVD
ncbi:MAG TPA: PSD1 and planctomycete cytochrome C domain-containing protein [Gemmataceae bacterium]|nr:PSD1 and planctomycete cytochrome C domain-containing protein [Gemmataceae bacterium]